MPSWVVGTEANWFSIGYDFLVMLTYQTDVLFASKINMSVSVPLHHHNHS